VPCITIAEVNAIKTLTLDFNGASGEFEKTTETEVLDCCLGGGSLICEETSARQREAIL
jgi:hypothetical protein